MQNRIQKIEGLDGLKVLRNLELAANRIRVRAIDPWNPSNSYYEDGCFAL